MMKKGTNLKGNQGFTFIEVMIAMLVLSIGLLGLAGLQLTGLRYNQSGYLRAQANILAYDIIDRMRANPTEASAGTYANISGSSTSNPYDGDCMSSDDGCTAVQLVDGDAFEWIQNITAQLPSGTGQIVRDGGIDTITVGWTEMTNDGPAEKTVSINTRL